MLPELFGLFTPITQFIKLDQRLPQQFTRCGNFSGRPATQCSAKAFAAMLQLRQRIQRHMQSPVRRLNGLYFG
jgi:hypothetical protein